MTTATWQGRRGSVILGPTEHRVARWLADRTRSGRITIRTADLVTALRLERSEAYRITARLRVLGLFGVENDRGGTKGGRRYWRTSIEHDGAELDGTKHRTAWSRIVAWSRERSARARRSLAAIRATTTHAGRSRPGALRAPATPAGADMGTAPAGGTFADRMRRYGLGPLMDQWRVGS